MTSATRRTLLQYMGASTALVFTNSARAAATVNVGMIATLSGPTAITGEMMRRAAQLFLDNKAKAATGGLAVNLIIRDDGGPNPEVAKRLLQDLVIGSGVQYIVGIAYTPNANAIAPLLTQAKIPCVLTNAGGAATTRLSPYLFRTSFTSWQTCFTLGSWAAKNGYKRMSTLVSDFVAGHDCEAGFIKGFTSNGGTIVASDSMPLMNPNFVPFLQRVKGDKPDALFTFNSGGTQVVPFLKAYDELGLRRDGIQLMGPGDITDDTELRATGSLAEGVITSHVYSPSGKRPANAEFLSLWAKAYPDAPQPNFMAASTWDGMQAICDAIKATGGKADSAAAVKALSSFKSDTSPKGTVWIDPATRDIVEDVYIREVKIENGVPVNSEFQRVPQVKDPWKELNPA